MIPAAIVRRSVVVARIPPRRTTKTKMVPRPSSKSRELHPNLRQSRQVCLKKRNWSLCNAPFHRSFLVWTGLPCGSSYSSLLLLALVTSCSWPKTGARDLLQAFGDACFVLFRGLPDRIWSFGSNLSLRTASCRLQQRFLCEGWVCSCAFVHC